MDEEQRRRLHAKAKIKDELPIWSVKVDPAVRDRFTVACRKSDLKLFKTLEFLMEEFVREVEGSKKTK